MGQTGSLLEILYGLGEISKISFKNKFMSKNFIKYFSYPFNPNKKESYLLTPTS